ncbi:hypothetical protein BC628DRAFT_1379945 [Trametes gibbosa]|nr:hypothetical protein BC628DRAFT_1379945 [Trametes gibbosa]
MRFAAAVFASGLLTAVSAHFQLQYPAPRGDFVAAQEVGFCDGYADAVTNRTVFPTKGGKFSINAEHPSWTLGGIVATVSNPNSFDTFKSNGQFQYVVPFFKTTGEGAFCFPVDLADQNIDGVTDGANITLQFIFDGGDGQLYQCADLTLSATATIPDSVSCTNASNAAVTPVSTSVAVPTSNAASVNNVVGLSGLAGVLGAIAALL